MKKRNMFKIAAVTALAMFLTIAPSSQALAYYGCYGGYCHGNGYQGGYNPPANQQYSTTSQNYSTTRATTPEKPSAPKVFDPTVYDIQEMLFEKGYYEGDVDGLYGNQTQAALLQFQEDKGIKKSENADIKALKADLSFLEALDLYTLL